MSAAQLVDTDVLIEYLRGSDRAAEFLESLPGELVISGISVAELFSGVKGEEESEALDQFMLAFELAPIDARLAKEAGLIRQRFHPSHEVGLADALIAATVVDRNAELITFNVRHYPMLESVRLPNDR